ncbi:hypothetical protein GPJ56_004943 [Histomonas meleagridis]|uniref:uncharacterized protein n=1 Tax=Histomonas meleagridis TaxID=135588 RepID=UPI003559FD9E|nr:hypothetical protein GPJ56_004943 [Histomonas meleagridis]KAH0798531.1 hypothetical protein GO595_008396 [Histomonas meleagridis]
MELNEKQLEKALSDYNLAYEFTKKTHESDLNRIDSLNGLMENFDDFFYEFVYVVLASGFKGRIAAKLTPLLVDCKGDMDKMGKIFKNKSKLNAINKIWNMKDQWDKLRSSFHTVNDLTSLPYIGDVTKYHLARNIGLISCAKPDLHLCRWAEKICGKGDEESVSKIINAIANKVGRKQGGVDFALWVWLSHNKGDELECCNGGYALR